MRRNHMHVLLLFLYILGSCLGACSMQGSSTPEQQELAGLTAQTLVRLYQEQAPDKLPLIKSLLQGQGHKVS